MSYNGSGTFVINTAGQPVVSGTVISSTAFNALTADLATGLSTAITKDGQTTPTANIPMGNNKITGLAAGTAATDAANLSQVQSTAAKLINSISGADTITGTLSPTLTAYAAGQMFYFVAAGDNTGAVTLNINSLGAKSITRDGTTALIAGDIKSGEICVVVYDGTQFQLVNAANSFSGNVTAAKFIPTGNVTAGNGMYLPTTNTLAFSTDGTERLRIDASGNAGLGVTPSAWQSTRRVVQVGANGGALWGINSGAGTCFLSNNTYYDGTNYKYINTANATYYAQASDGKHEWHVAASGTAGNNITSFTQAMTLDASGNLGVGTTSPISRIHAEGAGVTIRMKTTGAIGSGSTCFLQFDGSEGDSGYFGFGGTANVMDVWNRRNGAITFATNDTERARITSGGDLYCQGVYNNTSASAANVFVASDGLLQRSTSSLKYKHDVKDATHGLAEVLQLRSVTYKGNNDGDKIFGGLIAEEVDAIGLTEFVQYADDGSPDALAYGNMVSILVKAIQEQQAMIKALEAKVAALEAK